MIEISILKSLIVVVVVLIVLGSAIPLLWPMVTNTSSNITAMTGTDAGTTSIKAFWPVIILIIGLGLAIGLIVFALKKFGMMGGGMGMFIPFIFPAGIALAIIWFAGIVACIALIVTLIRERKIARSQLS